MCEGDVVERERECVEKGRKRSNVPLLCLYVCVCVCDESVCVCSGLFLFIFFSFQWENSKTGKSCFLNRYVFGKRTFFPEERKFDLLNTVKYLFVPGPPPPGGVFLAPDHLWLIGVREYKNFFCRCLGG